MMDERIVMQPVGWVRGGRAEATKDGWGNFDAVISIRDDMFGPDALASIDLQSHIEVVFHFHEHADEKTDLGARHPRNRTDCPRVGIFTQRGRMRVNRIGIGVCRLVGVDGLDFHVRGLDAIDGTPVLDIKPWWSGHAPRGTIREPDWAREIMKNYW
jgi:tRNA (Thr-GGU) A37 N-methylase